MKMSYRYNILLDNYQKLQKVKFTLQTNSIPHYYTISNSHFLFDALDSLDSLEIFNAQINTIQSQFYLMTHLDNDEIRVSDNIGGMMSNAVSNIIQQMSVIINFLDNAGYGQKIVGFDIKMPSADNLDDFISDLDEFNKMVLSCPYFNIDGEKIILEGTDTGSIWIVCAVTGVGTRILNNLAKLIDQAMKIRSHNQNVKQQKELFRAQKLKNDFEEEMLKVYKEMRKQTLRMCVEDMESETGIKLNEEDKVRAEKAISSLGDLLTKGMEIYPSLDAPQEVKNIFPDTKSIDSLPEPQKMLLDNNRKDDE